MVLSYEDWHIRFHSKGVVEMLGVAGSLHLPLIGRDIFKLVADVAISPPRTFKSDVKRSMSTGQAISTTLRLQAVRATVEERPSELRCVTHWTPLKDEHAAVAYIVLTLST